MKRYILTLLSTLFAAHLFAANDHPLYIVNGVIAEEIASIPPNDIENVEMLPADEQTIAQYGEAAFNGVMLITLRYDQSAIFSAGTSFGDYIAQQVKWQSDDPVARVVIRYKITAEGKTVIISELESTDSRLKRRVLKAVEESPLWQPACKNGQAVESEGVLKIQLPAGKRMPREAELIWR